MFAADAGLAVGHNGRDGDADRPVTDDVGEAVHDFTDDRCHILRCRLLRRGDAKSLRRELASRKVDGRSFDAAAADVDAEHGRASYRFFAHAREPSDIRPLLEGQIEQTMMWNPRSRISEAESRRTAAHEIQSAATQLAEAPRVEAGVEGVRVGEVEAVETSVYIDPADDLAPVPFHGDRLQPGRICGRVGVRLELEEDQRAGDVHQRVGVHRVRAEVRDSGDNRSLRDLG